MNQLIFVYNLCIFGGLAGLILGSYGTELIKSYLTSGDTGLTLQVGSSYLRILLWSMPAFALVQVYVSTLKECGETRLPMWASTISVFTNLVLNYLLIYGKYGFPKMGIEGAATATVAARFVELSIVLLWIYGRKAYSFTVGLYCTLKVPWKSVKIFMWKGFPLLINEALWASAMAVLTGCYAKEGLVTVAALSIANTLNKQRGDYPCAGKRDFEGGNRISAGEKRDLDPEYCFRGVKTNLHSREIYSRILLKVRTASVIKGCCFQIAETGGQR